MELLISILQVDYNNILFCCFVKYILPFPFSFRSRELGNKS
jgi:hypothetical protein